MELSVLQRKRNLEVKLPELRKALAMVELLKAKAVRVLLFIMNCLTMAGGYRRRSRFLGSSVRAQRYAFRQCSN